jgi:hypothetical protein
MGSDGKLVERADKLPAFRKRRKACLSATFPPAEIKLNNSDPAERYIEALIVVKIEEEVLPEMVLADTAEHNTLRADLLGNELGGLFGSDLAFGTLGADGHRGMSDYGQWGGVLRMCIRLPSGMHSTRTHSGRISLGVYPMGLVRMGA